MKRSVYSEPIVELIDLEVEDVICTSTGDNDSPWALDRADFSITE